MGDFLWFEAEAFRDAGLRAALGLRVSGLGFWGPGSYGLGFGNYLAAGFRARVWTARPETPEAFFMRGFTAVQEFFQLDSTDTENS